ncbi:hypothetical protein [Streptomyces sp. NPDC004726]
MTNTKQPFLTVHAALVLLAAVVFGVVLGTLAFWSTGNVPSAVLVGLTTTGISVPALRGLIQ